MVEDLSPDTDSATQLSMEGRTVRDKERRAGPATLGAVQWTVSGAAMAAGAPAVKLVEVELLLVHTSSLFPAGTNMEGFKPVVVEL